MDLMDHMTMPGPSSPAASLVGRFLVAAPSMPDERFRKSVVFVCKHDDDGALGIIVNNSVDDLPLGQVYKQLGIDVPSDEADRPVLFGGPVETSRGLVLHSADYKRDETLLIDGGMALTASLEILKDMAGGSGPQKASASTVTLTTCFAAANARRICRASSIARCRTMPGWWSMATPNWCSTPTSPPNGSAPSIAWAARAAPAAGSTWPRSRTRPVAPDGLRPLGLTRRCARCAICDP